MRIAVVIPVYNEREFLPTLIERLDAVEPPVMPDGTACERTIVVVDDGSTDGSTDLVRALGDRPDVTAIIQGHNRGKGAAIAAGMTAAVLDPDAADAVIIQDADLEYHPRDHAVVLGPILSGDADAVIGSRFIGGVHRVLYYWHAVANRAITTASNMLTNLNLTDVECGFKAFTAPVVRALDIKERAFGVEPEIVAKLARMRTKDATGAASRRLRVFEVPVSYAGRTYAEGKKITWRDGVSAMRCIATYSGLLGIGGGKIRVEHSPPNDPV